MSYRQYVLQSLMDMGSFLGATLGAILNYKRERSVNCYGSFSRTNIDNSSYAELQSLNSGSSCCKLRGLGCRALGLRKGGSFGSGHV